jgi:hypothetical protein
MQLIWHSWMLIHEYNAHFYFHQFLHFPTSKFLCFLSKQIVNLLYHLQTNKQKNKTKINSPIVWNTCECQTVIQSTWNRDYFVVLQWFDPLRCETFGRWFIHVRDSQLILFIASKWPNLTTLFVCFFFNEYTIEQQ